MPIAMTMAEGASFGARTGSVNLSINARVFGIPQVEQLDFAILKLMKTQERKAAIKAKVLERDKQHLEVLKMEVMQRKVQHHGATKYNEDITMQTTKIEAMDKAQEKLNETLRQEELIRLSLGGKKITQAEQTGALLILQEQENAAMAKSNSLLRINRREVLASTMSIFGMTMSIWQITNAFSALAGENKELKKDMQTLQAVMMGATGPIMLAMGLTQLSMAWSRLNIVIRMSMPLFFTMAALYMTMTTHSRQLKVVFGALTGAMAGLTVAIIAKNVAQIQSTALTWADIYAKLVQIGVISLGTGLAVAFAAVGAAVAYYATIPKESAQTELGQYRRMKRDASIYAHEGEVVTRPIEDWGGRDSRSETVIVIDGNVVDRVEAKRTKIHNYVGI